MRNSPVPPEAPIRFEIHAHTAEVSSCGKVPARDVAALCHAAGYEGLVITDHYIEEYFAALGAMPWREKASFFLSGYRNAKAFGDEHGMTVLAGLELRFRGSANDYLVYGLTEQEFIEYPELYLHTPASFHELARAHGWLFTQAHPFRKGIVPADPAFLEGVEVYNANPRHDSRNHLAKAFAAQHGLLPLGGSDLHQLGDEGRGGIVMKRPMDIAGFVQNLRNRAYALLPPEER